MTDLKIIMEQRKLNNRAERVDTPQAFIDKFADMKATKRDALFGRYVETVIRNLIPRLPFLTDGETYLSMDKLINACGEFQFKNKRYWLWNELKDIYPFMMVVAKGSNLTASSNPFEKNTKIKIVNERLLDMLLHEKSPKSVFWHFYTEEDLGHPDLTSIPIDMANLRRFIEGSEFELEGSDKMHPKLSSKIQSNVWQAMLIEKIGLFTEQELGEAQLPMVPAPSAFGRTYYTGLNIQNVSKQVRSAIIGHHYQYDMNAAVFATKLFLFGTIMGGDNELVGTTRGTYTRQYLAEKNQIRNRLARECFEGIDIGWDAKVKAVKDALTAVGFGAKPTGQTWMTGSGLKGTAIADIIKAPDARAAFLADPWVKSFFAEQRNMEDAILAYAENEEGYEEMCAVVREANGANGRVTRGGQMAFMYQHWETRIMNVAVKVLAAFGIEPIARIHDAFLVRERLPAKVLDEISVAWGLRDYLSLDCDEVREWLDAAFKRNLVAADAELAKHREVIAREEAKAQKQSALKRAGW